MTLGYTIPNAEAYIKAGRKIHTFRLDPKNRWKPGLVIHHATGVRSKKYNCFQQDKCTATQKARFEYYGGRLSMWVNGRKMSQRQTAEFVYNDGLESVHAFVQFIFYDKKGKRKKVFNKDVNELETITRVTGNIIHWTGKIYY